MSKDKIYKLADKFESKLKKIATNSPNTNSVHQTIMNFFDSVKGNPILKGCTAVSPNTNVSGSIGEDLLVYFQVRTDPRYYDSIVNRPRRAEIINFLKPAVEQILRSSFSGYDFKVTVGITI